MDVVQRVAPYDLSFVVSESAENGSLDLVWQVRFGLVFLYFVVLLCISLAILSTQFDDRCICVHGYV